MNKALIGTVTILALYALLVLLFPIDALIVIFNGAFIGAFVAGAIVYRKLIVDSFISSEKYDRVRQMTIGITLGWVARFCACGYFSFYRYLYHSSEANPFIVSFIVYLCAVACCLQVGAASYDEGVWNDNTEGQLLYLGTSVGILVAILVILWQGLIV